MHRLSTRLLLGGPGATRSPASVMGLRRHLRETCTFATWTFEIGSALEVPLDEASREFGNDPSAGSPTETLLRLLLPLDSQV